MSAAGSFDACACGRGLVCKQFYALGRVHRVCEECAVEKMESDAGIVVQPIPCEAADDGRKNVCG